MEVSVPNQIFFLRGKRGGMEKLPVPDYPPAQRPHGQPVGGSSWAVEALEARGRALAVRFTRGCSPRAVSIHSRAIFNNGSRIAGSLVRPASRIQSRAYRFIALSVATAASIGTAISWNYNSLSSTGTIVEAGDDPLTSCCLSGTVQPRGLLVWGRERRCPMAGSPVDRPDRNFSAGYAILQSQEPLPPYGLDPRFDDPFTRKRIGEVIARGMEQQVSERYGGKQGRRSWRLRRFRR